jgi:hypothetical protein
MQGYIAAEPEQAARLIADARALDDLLGPSQIEPSDLLQARLISALPEPVAETAAPGGPVRRDLPGADHPGRTASIFSFGRPAFRAPIAAAAALVIGIGLGFVSGALTAPSSFDAESEIYADAFSAFEEDWIDWMESDA